MNHARDAVRGRGWLLVLAWLWVGVPFAWGVYELVIKAVKLFGG